ncbi:FtsW/RodA/SpoVE family cell cycle protein [Marinilactibacillus piezotolerans]|uniref:FtsW/RodA/SpoVE family cell cycle protein n=1 Tax=Marinilactibacillus piezotolerans TaxID=258723 RepID=UPI0009B01C85|nr:FtsW/RodA/SpoVE family cell cycle protein [Marinilactibacillus piezotolerans]
MSNNKENQKIDYGIILTVMLLALISISMIYSTTALMGGAGLAPTIMQAVWYGLGAIAVCVIMQFDSEQLWKMTTYLYIGGILLLILTSLFYDRNLETATGARSWIRLGPIGTIQPSEFVKIPYILMLARLVTRHNSHYQNRDYASDFKLIGKLALFSAIPTALVLLQNDLGTTLVYLAVFIGVVLLSGIKWQILLPAFLAVAGLGTTLILLVVYNRDFLLQLGFSNYQFARIDTWLNPYQGTSDTSYQVTQVFKAIGSGGIFGKGLGTTEVHIPVRESDMIFSTIGENFGFIGGAFLIFIYFVLIYHMVKIVYDTKNEFYAYIATGVIMMIAFHVLENIGMSIGLLPMTGIPLPFISQGGSSLLGNMMGIGLIMSMRYHHKSYFFSGDGEDFYPGA